MDNKPLKVVITANMSMLVKLTMIPCSFYMLIIATCGVDLLVKMVLIIFYLFFFI